MTETIIDPIEAARQISNKAQSELDSLQAQLPDLQQKVVNLQTEEEQILQAIEGRKTHSTALKQSLQTAQTAHKEALAYAGVASGTIGEIDAIKSAVARKGELDATQNQHDETVQEHSASAEQDLARLTVIRSEHEQTMAALHDLHDRMRAVEQVKQRSLDELGASLNDALTKEHQAYRLHTEEARAALVAAQMDEQVFLTGAAAQMKQWPTHRTFKDALGTDSALIRILQADLAYLDQLITDSAEAAQHINHPSIPALPRTAPWNWSELLLVTSPDLHYAGFGSVQTVETLKTRRQDVATFLEQCKQIAS